MVWAVCADLGVQYANAVRLYQSRYFEEFFPRENARFRNVVYVDAAKGDRANSLLKMRKQMLKGPFSAAVFIGGMEGILEEHELFPKPESSQQLSPRTKFTRDISNLLWLATVVGGPSSRKRSNAFS